MHSIAQNLSSPAAAVVETSHLAPTMPASLQPMFHSSVALGLPGSSCASMKQRFMLSTSYKLGFRNMKRYKAKANLLENKCNIICILVQHNWWLVAEYIQCSCWVLVHWNGSYFKSTRALHCHTNAPCGGCHKQLAPCPVANACHHMMIFNTSI